MPFAFTFPFQFDQLFKSQGGFKKSIYPQIKRNTVPPFYPKRVQLKRM